MTRINLFLIFLGLVAIDQLSKYIIRHTGGFYICNPNVAFGINIPPAIFWVIWMGIIALLLIALYKKTIIHNSLFIILILAGAISNLIDRLYFSCIIDFIDVGIWPASNAVRSIAGWPVFNLADVFIVVGAVLLLYYFIKKEK